MVTFFQKSNCFLGALAQLWAGLLARLNAAKGSAVGFIIPALYQNAAAPKLDTDQPLSHPFRKGSHFTMITKPPEWEAKQDKWYWGILRFFDFDFVSITHETFFDLHITFSKKGAAHVSLYRAIKFNDQPCGAWTKLGKEATMTISQNAYKINAYDRRTFERELMTPIEKKTDWNSDEYWEFVQNEGTHIAREKLQWTIGGRFIVKKKIN